MEQLSFKNIYNQRKNYARKTENKFTFRKGAKNNTLHNENKIVETLQKRVAKFPNKM